MSKCTSYHHSSSTTFIYNGGVPKWHDGKGIRHVHVTEGVEEIKDNAFREWTSLKTIYIPNNVKRIGDYAFALSSLLMIDLPESIERIGCHAFAYCYDLIKFTLASRNNISHVYVGDMAFFNCVSLQAIQLSTSSLIRSQMFQGCQSLKILYTKSRERNSLSMSRKINQDFILLSLSSLSSIQEVINDVPNDIPPSKQMEVLQQTFQRQYPIIGSRALKSNLNLLHLLVHIPNTDIYQAVSNLLRKCPQAIQATDMTGRTPFHHVVAFTKHNMDTRSYELLLRNVSNFVVHQAIRSGAPWHEIDEIVRAKIDVLTLEDEKSGLKPFMMAATADKSSLDSVYGLLSMQPDLLNKYVTFKT